MKPFLRGLACLAVVCLLGAPTASAQFTSQYQYVAVAGNFNGFNTFNTNMVLVSNGVWMGYFSFEGLTNRIEFLFSTRNFTHVWKQVSQANFVLPLSATSTTGGAGNDIVISNFVTGTLRFQLNENTLAYTVTDVTPGYPAGEVWINELHYNEVGTDSNEFIEVAGPAGVNLSTYQLILYNGGNGLSYNTRTLSGTIPNQMNGFGAVSFSYSPNTVQNGDPDGVALVRNSTNVLEFLSYGGTFVGANGAANGMASVDIDVREFGSTPIDHSLQRVGIGARGTNFVWIGPTNGSPGQANDGQTMRTGVPPAIVTASNLVRSVASPTTGDTVHVDFDVASAGQATNMTGTVFYRLNSNGLFRPLPTSRTGLHFRTINPIPAVPGGTIVEYYAFLTFTGTGTNSPVLLPATAPLGAPQYGVTRVSPGAVWINEINASDALFDGDGSTTNEYVELAGRAGSDISQWKIEIYNQSAGLKSSHVIPSGTVLPNDASGYGFFVLGDPGVANVDIVFTNVPNAENLEPAGGVRLLNEFGLVQYALSWSVTPGVDPGLTNFTYIGYDDDFFEEGALSLTGTSSTYGAFAWTSQVTWSAGAANTGQTLTGGNTNLLPPFIACPSNVVLLCANSAIPTVNLASVSATGLCSGGAVTVSHVGDTTNSGTGCFGSPKIISRTYRAVSACGTTSDCVQLITLEDKIPPLLVCNTQALANAGFEDGDFTGWSLYGNLFTNIGIASLQPRSGFRHASVRGTSSSAMIDASGTGLNGFYLGGPLRARPGATTGTAFSVFFNGVNQYAEVPYSTFLNPPSFSFAFWARPTGVVNTVRTLVASRDFSISTVSGFFLQIDTNNAWQFWTGDGAFWDILTGPAAPSSQWAHVVGTFSFQPSNCLKRLWINGAMVAQQVITNYSVNTTRPLRLAAGATEGQPAQFFRGLMDDVRIYDYGLSTAEVATLYNSGAGGVGVGEELAHWKMDEPATVGVSTSGFFQGLAAATGQQWTASAWALVTGSDPMKGNNRAFVALQYLNSAGAIVGAFTSASFSASSPTNTYIRLAATGVAPANTVTARLTTVFLQDTAASGGTVFFDDAVLSTLVVSSSNTCPSMPNLLALVSATDTCSAVTFSQSPAAGVTVTPTNTTVTFTATDACGLSSSCTVPLTVLDDTPPTIQCAAPITASCVSALAPPSTNGIVATDNCGPATVTFVGATTNAGTGCAGNPILITRTYQATDQNGNASFCTQLVTVVDTNPPALTCVTAGPLGNPGFESGTLSSWNRFGPNIFVENFAPKTGTRHAKIFGQFNGQENFTGIFQDLPARSGQVWRASAYLMTATNDALQGANRVEMKLEFLGPNGFLDVKLAPLFTASTPQGVYLPFSVSGTAPEGCTVARVTFVFIQANNADFGAIYIDDVSLALNLVSTATNSCQGVAPDLATAIGISDCGSIVTTQSPPPGVALNRGVTNISVYTQDACGNRSTCTVAVAVLDDVAPNIISGPTNLTVASTNQVPPADTNSVVASDNCSVRIVHDGDVVSATNPLVVITRTYRAIDSGTNSALYRQVFTVDPGSVPPAPTNVVVVGFTLGTNIVIRSLGTNSWSAQAEYTTNLPSLPQVWLPVPGGTNQFAGGTNVTTFNPPVTNTPVLIRVRQQYP